jgi:hypothetical protein
VRCQLRHAPHGRSGISPVPHTRPVYRSRGYGQQRIPARDGRAGRAAWHPAGHDGQGASWAGTVGRGAAGHGAAGQPHHQPRSPRLQGHPRSRLTPRQQDQTHPGSAALRREAVACPLTFDFRTRVSTGVVANSTTTPVLRSILRGARAGRIPRSRPGSRARGQGKSPSSPARSASRR